MSRRSSTRIEPSPAPIPVLLPARGQMRAAAVALARSFGLAGVLGAAGAVAPAIVPAASTLEAQAVGRVTGTVTDTASGRPLSAVQIAIAGTRLGGLTDEQGRFTVNNVPAGSYTVEGRRLGYVPVTRRIEVTSGGTATVALSMRVAALNLQAVVTTGVVDPTSGTRVPFTVGRVDAENAPVPSANAVETIQGKIAGVTVVPSGQPGSGTNILLRSPTSISKSTRPLIVVDGVIHSQSFTGSTADLESMDIESVEVVKGAAAASLYGSRASSGVIQIRTQPRRGPGRGRHEGHRALRGRQNALGGKMDWAQYHYYLTERAGPVRGRDGHGRAARAARREAGVHALPGRAVPRSRLRPGRPLLQSGQHVRKNSVNVAQKSGRTNWFLSFVNSREDGVVLNSGGYKQNDVRLNLDHPLRDNFKLSFSGYHSRSNRTNLYGDTFFDLINQAPDVDLRSPTRTARRSSSRAIRRRPRGEPALRARDAGPPPRARARRAASRRATRRFELAELRQQRQLRPLRPRRTTSSSTRACSTEGFGAGRARARSRRPTGTTDALNAAASATSCRSSGALHAAQHVPRR